MGRTNLNLQRIRSGCPGESSDTKNWNTGIREGRLYPQSIGTPHVGYLDVLLVTVETGYSRQGLLNFPYSWTSSTAEWRFVWCFVWVRSGSPFLFYLSRGGNRYDHGSKTNKWEWRLGERTMKCFAYSPWELKTGKQFNTYTEIRKISFGSCCGQTGHGVRGAEIKREE